MKKFIIIVCFLTIIFFCLCYYYIVSALYIGNDVEEILMIKYENKYMKEKDVFEEEKVQEIKDTLNHLKLIEIPEFLLGDETSIHESLANVESKDTSMIFEIKTTDHSSFSVHVNENVCLANGKYYYFGLGQRTKLEKLFDDEALQIKYEDTECFVEQNKFCTVGRLGCIFDIDKSKLIFIDIISGKIKNKVDMIDQNVEAIFSYQNKFVVVGKEFDATNKIHIYMFDENGIKEKELDVPYNLEREELGYLVDYDMEKKKIIYHALVHNILYGFQNMVFHNGSIEYSDTYHGGVVLKRFSTKYFSSINDTLRENDLSYETKAFTAKKGIYIIKNSYITRTHKTGTFKESTLFFYNKSKELDSINLKFKGEVIYCEDDFYIERQENKIVWTSREKEEKKNIYEIQESEEKLNFYLGDKMSIISVIGKDESQKYTIVRW